RSSGPEISRSRKSRAASSAVSRNVSITAVSPAGMPADRSPTHGWGVRTLVPRGRRYRRNRDGCVTHQRRLRESSSTRSSPGGYPEEGAFALGRVRERLVDRQRRTRLVLAPDVDEVERMRGRLDVAQVEL